MLLDLPLRFLCHPISLSWLTQSRKIMDLCSVISRLNALTPPALAESWDNVGLLVEPSPPHQVQKLLLTNDLTEDVLEEALQLGANMVLSYHPPIFKALKRLTWTGWKERLMVKALENRLAIYSPHTACDALPNGINDWLGRALGTCVSIPLCPSSSLSHPGGFGHLLEFSCDPSHTVMSRLKSLQDVSVRFYPVRQDGKDGSRISLSCSQKALLQVLPILAEDEQVYRNVELLALQKPPMSDTGMGRLCTLPEPISIATALERAKQHLGLPHLALGRGKTLESLVSVMAVCAGSGSSILSGVPADLYLTGEMSHHDVLDAVSEGRSVILCEHSNSERGYLQELRGQIEEKLDRKVQVLVSQKDQDPLQVV
ncbi:NIF3-like protein 1 [Bombina bombina]|uniref:NIF3-like protein 1 n=1 Tax=Bombina bombina TaxID=8345 RepID=UPI00235B2346|nr:NIF3-like protein 1 [Bombina bombina]